MAPRLLVTSLPSLMSLALVAVLGGCVTSPGSATTRPATGADARGTRTAIRVNNGTLDRLDVYVLEAMREWFLGRVEPGADVRLSLPPDVHIEGRTMVRLAILANAPRSGHPSRGVGAVLTVWQPLSRLLAHDWLFAQGQLMGAAGRPER